MLFFLVYIWFVIICPYLFFPSSYATFVSYYFGLLSTENEIPEMLASFGCIFFVMVTILVTMVTIFYFHFLFLLQAQ